MPIDFRRGDPVEQIRADRARTGLPLGEEKPGGVDKVIDAVGFQARGREHPDRESPSQVISDASRLVDAAGAIAVAGVYPDRNPHPGPGADGRENLVAPWGALFSKGVAVRFGRTHDRRYTVLLRDLVVAGRARPSMIVTHHGTLADAAALHWSFDRREHGVIKAVLHPR
ncbi:hypothetical protein [Micromonospora sp. NPDC049102]|uniref:hypothetical protein n=1 Tax=Micromonospora sp. NPDC049102 TaxID=3364265 RepID=UPI00371CB392